jgi:hypothetical protein
MRAMLKRGFAAALVSVVTAASSFGVEDPWVVYPGGEGPGSGVHIVLVAGDEEYRSEEALPMLGKVLSVRHGFRCTVLFSVNPETGEIDPDDGANVPGLEALADADMLVMFWRFRRLADEDMKRVVDYVESGRPLLGIRTATHAFNYEADSPSPYAHWSFRSKTWPDGFGRQVLGETWVNHHGKHGSESTRGVVPVAARKHPILRGVDDVWGPTDVYGIRDLPLDSLVLLEGSVRGGMQPDAPALDDPRNEPRMPIVWLRERALDSGATQRVVCSTIGASTDMQSAGLRRLLVNSCYWGVGLEGSVTADSSVDVVGEYAPTPFGFGKYTKGVRPSDHRLAD